MAPYGQALKVRPNVRKDDRSSSTSKSEAGNVVLYAGDVDPEWSIGKYVFNHLKTSNVILNTLYQRSKWR